jgi:hypothetical protein
VAKEGEGALQGRNKKVSQQEGGRGGGGESRNFRRIYLKRRNTRSSWTQVGLQKR